MDDKPDLAGVGITVTTGWLEMVRRERQRRRERRGEKGFACVMLYVITTEETAWRAYSIRSILDQLSNYETKQN